MKDYLKLFWLVPAIAFLFHFLITIMMAAAPRDIAALAARFYEPLFYITPTIGIVVLLCLLGFLIVERPLAGQVKVGRTIVLALLDIVSPILFVVLGIVLSGFAR